MSFISLVFPFVKPLDFGQWLCRKSSNLDCTFYFAENFKKHKGALHSLPSHPLHSTPLPTTFCNLLCSVRCLLTFWCELCQWFNVSLVCSTNNNLPVHISDAGIIVTVFYLRSTTLRCHSSLLHVRVTTVIKWFTYSCFIVWIVYVCVLL